MTHSRTLTPQEQQAGWEMLTGAAESGLTPVTCAGTTGGVRTHHGSAGRTETVDTVALPCGFKQAGVILQILLVVT